MIWVAVVFLSLFGGVGAQNDRRDIDRGKRLYVASCARCHGMDGSGSEGPPLDRPDLEYASTLEELTKVIRSGIPGTEMPPSGYMNAPEARDLAAFVLKLGKRDIEPLSGVADRGQEIFFGDAGCADCHIVNGQGGSLGPDLTRVGSRRGVAYLTQHISDPSKAVPEAYRMVRIRTRDGQSVQGMRVVEDAFSIQVRDGGNRFHSFRKSEIERIERMTSATFMPKYRASLDDQELDDLVTYLAGLRGQS